MPVKFHDSQTSVACVVDGIRQQEAGRMKFCNLNLPLAIDHFYKNSPKYW